MKTLEEYKTAAMLLGMEYDQNDHTICLDGDGKPMRCYDPETMELVFTTSDMDWTTIAAVRQRKVAAGVIDIRRVYEK